MLALRLGVALLAIALLTHCSTPGARRDQVRAPVLLAIFAHPDDEASVAPVLASYSSQGVRVHLAVATDGRLGVSPHAGIPAGDALATARTGELQCAAEKLGLQPPIQFGLHDQLRMTEGFEPYGAQILELRERITRLFQELQPDAVITWGPSGWTGHPDHRIVGAVVTEVFQSRRWLRPSQLYYPAVPTGALPANNPLPVATVDPSFLPVRIAVSAADYDKAKAAWLCHRTQYTPEQIEQMHQMLVMGQKGHAHFQPAIVETARPDSLLPARMRR